jgi:hypothetical protein
MKIVSLNRRHVLRGACGFTLALPFMPSLLPRAMAAGDPLFKAPKRFVAFKSQHGGVALPDMFPPDATLTNKQNMFPGHDARWGKLVRKVDGDRASLCPAIGGKATAFTQRIVEKMNVIRGLDVPFELGHNTGGALGNFARNNTEDFNDLSKVAGLPYMPTIDQLMAWSPEFYPNLGAIKERTICNTTGYRGLSFMWSNAAARSGPIQEVPGHPSAHHWFDRLFVGAKPPTNPQRKPLVDLVLEDFKRTRDTHPRLSTADKQRMSDHMDRMAELQRRLSVVVSASCADAGKPAKDNEIREYQGANLEISSSYYQIFNEVVAAALVCGATRIATISIDKVFITFTGPSWHQDVAHMTSVSPEAQMQMTESQRASFEHVVLDLANRLDVEESPGVTVLDNSLLKWTQESGSWTHSSDSLPVVTIGGAGGFFKTGNYLDLRWQNPKAQISEWAKKDGKDILISSPGRLTGVTYNRWLANVMLAMGIPKSQWESAGQPGYGSPYMSREYMAKYGTNLSAIVASGSTPLPGIT